MKTLLLTSSLTLSLLFPAGSWAEWTQVSTAASGSNKSYVDLERIRKVNGLVYYWMLRDYLEPLPEGQMSIKVYAKVDCKTMRQMPLSVSPYRLPMAKGDAIITGTPPPEWDYAHPDSVNETVLNAVCAH